MNLRPIFVFFAISLLGLFATGCQRPARLESTALSTSGLGESISPGNYELSLGPEDDQREVLLHVPPAYNGSSQLPLLIVLHGGAQNAAGVQRLSGLDADADEFGFVVAYPNGSGALEDKILTWNAGHCCGYALIHQIDDAGFIKSLIDYFTSTYAIDPSRVYLTGISNGGMMAYRAGAELADKIAGIAPIAASLGGQAVEQGRLYMPDAPSSPVAVMAFNGMQDQHVLYEGGQAPAAVDPRVDISVAESIAFWVEANGCDPNPSTETHFNSNIIIDDYYSGCEGNSAVVLVTIVDGGHAWPGADRGLASDPPTQDISANEMMLEFFLMRPKER